MNNQSELKWFSFRQNNSGGYFLEEANLICEVVVIQAYSAKQALAISKKLFENYREYYDCCGERWDNYLDEEDGYELPSLWGEPISENSRTFTQKKAILHYLNGKTKTILFEEVRNEQDLKRIVEGQADGGQAY